MTRPASKRRLSPAAGYAVSAAFHLALFGWAWALPGRARQNDRVDVEIVETVKPTPVAPEPPKPEPPKPAEPIPARPTRRVAMTNPPPPTPTPPPPEAPPPDAPRSTAPLPGPVHLGLSLSSTSVGGGFAAPVGGSLAGTPGTHPTAPADDIGPLAHAAALSVQPEPIDTDIPAANYPKEALDAGFEGQVTLKIVIDTTGRVRRARIVKDPGYGLGAAAVKGATKFRFKPGLINGQPMAAEVTWVVTFELP